MKCKLEKWTYDYLKQIDLSDVPTLKIEVEDNSVYISTDDKYVDDLDTSFLYEISLKGLTDDQENVTEFGRKLEEIYDMMWAWLKEHDNYE